MKIAKNNIATLTLKPKATEPRKNYFEYYNILKLIKSNDSVIQFKTTESKINLYNTKIIMRINNRGVIIHNSKANTIIISSQL